MVQDLEDVGLIREQVYMTREGLLCSEFTSFFSFIVIKYLTSVVNTSKAIKFSREKASGR